MRLGGRVRRGLGLERFALGRGCRLRRRRRGRGVVGGGWGACGVVERVGCSSRVEGVGRARRGAGTGTGMGAGVREDDLGGEGVGDGVGGLGIGGWVGVDEGRIVAAAEVLGAERAGEVGRIEAEGVGGDAWAGCAYPALQSELLVLLFRQCRSFPSTLAFLDYGRLEQWTDCEFGFDADFAGLVVGDGIFGLVAAAA